jgi:hypothetical protein
MSASFKDNTAPKAAISDHTIVLSDRREVQGGRLSCGKEQSRSQYVYVNL